MAKPRLRLWHRDRNYVDANDAILILVNYHPERLDLYKLYNAPFLGRPLSAFDATLIGIHFANRISPASLAAESRCQRA
jgi:hypothetical protein